jgi:hypothetical protein
MKRVTATYTMDFDDDVPDEKCYACLSECMGQDGHFPSDDQVKIEMLPDGTPDPTRPE